MTELWLKDKELVLKEEWFELINSLKSDKSVTNKAEAKKVLKDKLIATIKSRIPNQKFGIFFSGGVDSTTIAILCKELEADFTCYCVGFQDKDMKEPEDITEAKKVAAKLGLPLKYKIYNMEEAEQIIKETLTILKKVDKTDVVNIGVGAVVLAAVKLAQQDNINYFLGGLGSEEIFAGYDRHDKVEDINSECWNGLLGMWERDLVRDFNLSQALKFTIHTPFLDKDLIEYAMQLPGEWKLSREEKKIILREIAEEWLGNFAWRKKKAAQYGSCFDKAISKLAKHAGFKLKKEWLESL
jgi:asparagine synthetase B (glutamine-hydrolysing)